MAGIIAHELRTPLATISLAINNLEQIKKEKENSKLANESIDTTKQAINNANKFIDMTLQNARNPRKMNEFPEKLSVRNCINKVIATYPFASIKDKEKVNINIKENFHFAGTQLLFTHVLYNLLKNSIKAINHKGTGTISIFTTKNEIFNCLVIKDTGIGIPNHILPNIMEKFATYWEKGTGLGLAFCKDALQSMNGSIYATSQESKHTKITLIFPKYRSFQKTIKLRQWPKNIVIVDKNTNSLNDIKNKLQMSVEYQNITCYTDPIAARIKLNEIFHKKNSKEQISAIISNIDDKGILFKTLQDRKIKRIWITDKNIDLDDNQFVDVIIQKKENFLEQICNEFNLAYSKNKA